MTNFVDAVLAQMGRLTEGEQRAVREEIEGHMEDHALLLESRGCSPEEAARQAEAAMGDPAEIGRALNAQLSHLWLYWKRFMMVLCAVALVGICFALREWWITEQLIREGAILP